MYLCLIAYIQDTGRPSPETKRAKRKRQKARRKLFRSSAAKSKHMYVAQESESNEMQAWSSNKNDQDDDDDCGVDTNVLEMRIEDGIKEQDFINETCMDEYSYECLLNCRHVLMNKVTFYRKKLEQEKFEKKKVIMKCEDSVQNIRSFYTNIALAPTRAEKIARAALSSTHTAKQFLREIAASSYCRMWP